MIDRYVVDFPKTFSGAMLVAVEPKMQRINKDDPKSAMEQSKDKNGVSQWLVSLSVAILNPDNPKTKRENIDATVTSAEKPYEKLCGTHVIIDGLKVGIMTQTRGGFSVFYSADGIRPAPAPRAAAA